MFLGGTRGDLFHPVHRRVDLPHNRPQGFLRPLVEDQHGRLCLGVGTVLTEGKPQPLDVEVALHDRTALLIACHQMDHTVGRAVEKIAADTEIPRGVLKAPALDMGGGVGVVALLLAVLRVE